MGGNLSKKEDINGYSDKLFNKISHIDILEYIKNNLSQYELNIVVDKTYIIFSDKDDAGFERVLMYHIDQFIEHMDGGEELDFIRLDKLITQIGNSHNKFY